MRFKTHLSILLTVASLLTTVSHLLAQNTPQLTSTVPAGTATEIGNLPGLQPPGEDNWYNYTRTYKPFVQISNSASISETSPTTQVKIMTDYQDGFKRSMQTIYRNYTSNAKKHLVIPTDSRFQQGLAYQFLPYAIETDNSINADPYSGFHDAAFQEQRSFFAAAYPNEGYTSYGGTKYVSDATQRKTVSYQPGKSQIGQSRGISNTKKANDASAIRIWNLDANNLPTSPGFYGVDQLFGKEVVNQDGSLETTFTDRDGRDVYRSRLLQTTGSVNEFGISIFIYDELGKLIYMVPPKATEAVGAATTIDTSILNKLCYQYQYDDLSRVKSARKPDEQGFTYYVYDKKQRVIMSSSPLLKKTNQWEVFFYDKLGRLIARSIYNDSNTRDYWQNIMDNPPANPATNTITYFLAGAGEGTYPAETAIPNNSFQVYSYYDQYAKTLDNNGSIYNQLQASLLFENDLLDGPGAETPLKTSRTQGMITGSKTRILLSPDANTGIGEWRHAVYYYDDKGRLMSLASFDKMSNQAQLDFQRRQYISCQYDFSDNLILAKQNIVNNLAPANQREFTELEKHDFESITGRLRSTSHKVDDGPWDVIASYTYDDLGRVKRKILGNYGEVQDLQYNIRGQLTAINGVYAETGNKQGESRTFGQSLKYDYGFAKLRYDGKIAGTLWRGTGNMHAYGYDYDKSGRLKTADYLQYYGTTWSNSSDDRSVSNLTYDKNGNIKSMTQRGPGYDQTAQQYMGTNMDVLTYTYKPNSNQLDKVEDAVTANLLLGDFQNGNVTTADYDYDANGNLTKDLNKGISAITYTYFNKPQKVTFSNGKSIQYTYDACGQKVQELLMTGSSVTKKTDYVGNFTYENDSVRYAYQSEGRTIIDVTSGTTKEEFFVKDYLGNVRSVIDVYNYPILQYLATYEIASAGLEGLFFDNIAEVRDDNPSSTSTTDLMSARLNGNEPNRMIGSALLMKVMAGDKVELNVNGYYQGFNPPSDNPQPDQAMLNSILNTLTGGMGGFVGSETHDPTLVSKIFTPSNYNSFITQVVAPNTDPSKPKAYLNYIVFDEAMRIVPAASGSFQVNSVGTWGEIGTTTPIMIPNSGFIAVYLDNRSRTDVFFDLMNVRFSRGKLKEENHYYPHGLPMGSMGSVASGFVPNKNKYQTNSYNKDFGLNMMDFHFRQYDPQIGRFSGVDPLASAGMPYGTYNGMGNDPVQRVDPMGLQDGEIPIMYSQIDEVVITTSRSTGKTKVTNDPNLSDGSPLLPGGDPWAPIGGSANGKNYYNEHGGGSGGSSNSLASAPGNMPGSPLIMSAIAVPVGVGVGAPAIGISAGVVSATGIGVIAVIGLYTMEEVSRRASEKTYVTYTKIGPGGEVYVGRTSGIGTPEDIVARRDRSHHMKGYQAAVVDRFATGLGVPTPAVGTGDSRLISGISAYTAIRGREQQLYDYYRLTGQPLGNSIKPVSPFNPFGELYHAASSLYFQEIAPFTGYKYR